MFLPFSPFLLFLLFLHVASAVRPYTFDARLKQRAPSLHSVIRRQTGQNTTVTNSTSNANATATTAAIVPLTLASDKQ